MPAREVPDTYRFLDFELDVRAYELRRHGRPIRLEPRPMDLLILLVERRGQLVTHDEIVERLWGKDVFVEVDAGIHTAVRKIRRALAGVADGSPLIESVPGRGYRFVAPGDAALSSTATRPVNPAAAPRRWRPRAGAAVVSGAALWLTISGLAGIRSEPPPIRVLRVTAFPGSEGGPPALSPDGNVVVFNWTGPEATADGDLWIKAIEGDALQRVTDTPRINEVNPAWSPDGRQIAFVRYEEADNRGVYIIPAAGGSPRKVADWGTAPSWLPDSQSLVFGDRTDAGAAPVHYDLTTGARRQLTRPPPGFRDVYPRVSHDGKAVAFVRMRGEATPFSGTSSAALFVVPLAGGDPRQLDDWVQAVASPAWSPDSREIFFPRRHGSSWAVFRVAVSGGAATPARGLPDSAYSVSISGARPDSTFRVAVVNQRSDVGLRLLDLQAPRATRDISAWSPFADSTQLDLPGSFSRDGQQFAFTSDRNGTSQIYVTSRDQPSVRTLTAVEGMSVGLPSWAPDGGALVFDAVDDNNVPDLFIVGANGGKLRRLTNDRFRELTPEWSSDGRWIYYSSDETGRSEVWKISAADGTRIQLTTDGGVEPHESADARCLYFALPLDNPFALTAVKRVPTDGGPATTVLQGVRRGAWAVVDEGIILLTGPPGLAPDPKHPEAIEIFTFADARARPLGALPFHVTGRGYQAPRVLAASPDGRWVVVSHMDHWERDIVVADHYR
jgi:Tol biopolymer transport system component/DNA-binding winged helix-turn-helix (wHTH) protein